MFLCDSRLALISIVKTRRARGTACTHLCAGVLELATVTCSTLRGCAHVLFSNGASAASAGPCHVGVLSSRARLTGRDAILSDQRQKHSCRTLLADWWNACIFVLAGRAFAGAVCRVAQQACVGGALGAGATHAFRNGVNCAAVVAVKLALGKDVAANGRTCKAG